VVEVLPSATQGNFWRVVSRFNPQKVKITRHWVMS